MAFLQIWHILGSVMHLTLAMWCLLLLAGFFAGFLNSLAGGGKLITLPILILLGIDSISANATSTVALILGVAGSFWGYRRQLPAILPWLRVLLFPSVLGGLLGGILLIQTPSQVFDFLVPYLILFATVLFMARNFFLRLLITDLREGARRSRYFIAFAQFLIGLYGGYFGAGMGILMLASASFMGLHHFVESNALKTFLGGAINLIAALYFVWKGFVHWAVALILTLGALPGYYLGALFAQRIPATLVRRLVVLSGILLALATFIEQMRK